MAGTLGDKNGVWGKEIGSEKSMKRFKYRDLYTISSEYKICKLYFPHFIIFRDQLDNVKNFRMLLTTVPINFTNSKVCLINEWSITF